MKFYNLLVGIHLICFLLPSAAVNAQHTASFDIAAIRNMRINMNGLNISGFYHFTERITAGIEMNRFFSVTRIKKDEELKISAWDLDLNFHYLLPLNKKISLYPLSGISHTSEKEMNHGTGEDHYERFWSFNTGAGLLYAMGKWSPHIEYSYTWGHVNQQFLLAGISYELAWSQKEKKRKEDRAYSSQ